jgi:MFS family permease
MYLPVPLFGYLCDRYSPPPLSFLATVFFGLGYLLAAFTYKSGPPADAVEGGTGWSFGVMILAFVGIGAGTSCMYLASVTACAKNFATAKHRGLMLAVPIAAFGLSGLWQSQVGAHLLYQQMPDGTKGDVNVFKYFIFLGSLLAAVGLLGTIGLRIVDEEVLIERGVEQLEQSGLLEASDFYHPSPIPTPPPHHHRRRSHDYGTLSGPNESEVDTASDSDSEAELTLTESTILKKRQNETRLRRKKSWLLNHATRTFLTDRTMWLLAAGFFLLTGPGEAYLNNVGTIIPTLTPKHWSGPPPAGSASTHVSIVALTSTFARLLTGTLSDLFAPSSDPDSPQTTRLTFSRLVLLLPSAFLLLLAFVNLSFPALVPQHPSFYPFTSAMLGLGYGACFSLIPIIISVVWDVENFATNWGVVAMMPAGGAAMWSMIYSIGYSRASGGDLECHGPKCFTGWGWGCAGSVTVAIVLWLFAWRTWSRRNVVV